MSHLLGFLSSELGVLRCDYVVETDGSSIFFGGSFVSKGSSFSLCLSSLCDSFDASMFWQGAAGGQSSGALGDRATAAQNLRDTQRSTEADAARRRLAGGATGSGPSNALESSKHRSPGHEDSAKDSVSFYDSFSGDLEQYSTLRNVN